MSLLIREDRPKSEKYLTYIADRLSIVELQIHIQFLFLQLQVNHLVNKRRDEQPAAGKFYCSRTAIMCQLSW
jgi:hypothetical protein